MNASTTEWMNEKMTEWSNDVWWRMRGKRNEKHLAISCIVWLYSLHKGASDQPTDRRKDITYSLFLMRRPIKRNRIFSGWYCAVLINHLAINSNRMSYCLDSSHLLMTEKRITTHLFLFLQHLYHLSNSNVRYFLFNPRWFQDKGTKIWDQETGKYSGSS